MRNLLLRIVITLVCFVQLTQEAYAQSEATPADRTVVALEFEGNRKVEKSAIVANLTTRVGKKLRLPALQGDIRKIWQMGFFSDIRVDASLVGTSGVKLLFVLTERPSVRKVFVSGNKQLDLDKINEVLDIKRESVLDISKVKKNRQKIHERYVAEGFYLSEVTYEVRPSEDAKNKVDIYFHIDEQAKVEVREVSFVGNEKLTDDELRAAITTKKRGAIALFSDGGVYHKELFERDLAILKFYYYDRGFLDVQVGEPKIRLSRDKRYMYLSIPIEEGPVYSVGKVDFKGDLFGSKADYYKRLTIAKGQIFNRSKVSRDIVGLTDFYRDKGYAHVNIQPATQKNENTKIVALTFEIERGKKVYYERINVRGNTKTRDKVIRREMRIAEGELYNQTNLERSRRRVTALGFFQEVNISTRRGSSDEFIVVNVEISERPTGTFQIGAGFSSVENFIAQAQISQNNLFGRGQSLSLQAQLSSLRQLFLLRFSEPYFLDTEWSFAFDIFNQSRAFGSFQRESTGGNLTWGHPISDESKVFLTYKLENLDITTGSSGFSNIGAVREPVEEASVANLFRGGVTSSLRGIISWDSRNNRLFPTAGWYHNAFVEVADKATGSENIFVRYGGWIRHYRKLWGPFIFEDQCRVWTYDEPRPPGRPHCRAIFNRWDL